MFLSVEYKSHQLQAFWRILCEIWISGIHPFGYDNDLMPGLLIEGTERSSELRGTLR